MTDTNTTPTPDATPAVDANAGTAPAAAPAQVTVDDLIQITKFLENLAQMGRLSQLEVTGLTPSFERIVSFLKAYEAQMLAAQAAQTASTVTEVSNEEIDTASLKSKKKAGKKK